MFEQQQQQVNQILQQTFANLSYNRKQMQQMLGTDQQTINMKIQPISNLFKFDDNCLQINDSSFNASESEQNQSLDYKQEQQYHHLMHQEQQDIQKNTQHKFCQSNLFTNIENHIKNAKRAISQDILTQQYSLYLISNPAYKLPETVACVTFQFSHIKDRNIMITSVGYSNRERIYKYALGTDEGQLLIFDNDIHKSAYFLQIFSRNSKILAMQWSKQMCYLAISSQECQLKVYQFRDNDKNWMRNPIEYLQINNKKLNSPIVSIQFISEQPLQLILQTASNQLLFLQMKRNFIHFKPNIKKLAIQLDDISRIELIECVDKNKQKGLMMAIAGQNLINFCILKPQFEIIWVYDKQKHFPEFSLGYSQINFRKQHNQLLIMWDKYAQVINFDIISIDPLEYKISISTRMIFGEKTIKGGFLSENLIYQISKNSILIYPLEKYSKDWKSVKKSQIIWEKKMDFSWIPHSNKISQAIALDVINVETIRLFDAIFCSKQSKLFWTLNHGIVKIDVMNFKQYIEKLVDANNDFKVGLTILKDAYQYTVYQFDNISKSVISFLIKKYSIRYVDFLKDILSSSQQAEILWKQQLLFIIHILISVNQQQHLCQSILPKIQQFNPTLLLNLQPFILNHQLAYLSPKSLSLFLTYLPRSVVSTLIYNLSVQKVQQDLPHQINTYLVEAQMHLQMIYINHLFGDYYTPIVILLAQLQNSINVQKQNQIVKALTYCFEITIDKINKNQIPISNAKNMIIWIIELFPKLIPYLLLYPEQFFTLELPELFSSNCLVILNSLSNLHQNLNKDFMTEIINKISYDEVKKSRCEKQYWLLLLKLKQKKLIQCNLWKAFHVLLFQQKCDVSIIDEFLQSNIMQVGKQLHKKNTNQVIEFFNSIVDLYPPCISLIKLVGNMLGEYMKVIKILIGSEKFRNELFPYLQQIENRFPKSSSEQLLELIRSNILLFVRNNNESLTQLIIKRYSQYCLQLVKLLNQDPEQQLKLVKQIIKQSQIAISKNQKQKKVYRYVDELKVMYLQLLAKTGQQNSVLPELKKQIYPIDQSLRICRQYAVLDAEAYLLIKCGGEGTCQQAIKIYFRILERELFRQHTLESLKNYIDKTIHSCLQNKKFFQQNQWLLILDELENFKKTSYKILNVQQWEQIRMKINNGHAELMSELLVILSLELVIKHIKKSILSYDLSAINVLVKQFTKNYLFQKEISKSNQKLQHDFDLQLTKQLFKESLKGYIIKQHCQVCHQNEQEKILMQYHCGHTIHPSCGNDIKYCVLCQQHIDNILWKQLDLKNKTISQILTDISQQLLSPKDKQKIISRISTKNRMQQFDFLLSNASKVYQFY